MPTTLPERLNCLFEQAGRAEAERQERERRTADKRRREIALQERWELKARALAPAAGERVWSWLDGPQADELRGSLRKFALGEVMILGWHDDRGRTFDGAYYGRWSVSLVAEPGALRVRRIGMPHGGVARLVNSSAALVGLLPAPILVALDRAIVSGQFLRTVARVLSERTEPDGLPPNTIRLW